VIPEVGPSGIITILLLVAVVFLLVRFVVWVARR
jgi:flagellin-like protein